MTRGLVVLLQGKSRAVVGDQANRFVIMLPESIDPDGGVVFLAYFAQRDLRTGVLRAAMLSGA